MCLESLRAGIETCLVSQAKKAPKTCEYSIKLKIRAKVAVSCTYQKQTLIGIDDANKDCHVLRLAVLILGYD